MTHIETTRNFMQRYAWASIMTWVEIDKLVRNDATHLFQLVAVQVYRHERGFKALHDGRIGFLDRASLVSGVCLVREEIEMVCIPRSNQDWAVRR